MSNYSEYNKFLTQIFKDLSLINQFMYQLIIIFFFVYLDKSINITNILNNNTQIQRYLLIILLLLTTLFLIIDWKIWKNDIRTLIFGLILFSYSLFINYQKNNFEMFMNIIKNNKNNYDNQSRINYLQKINEKETKNYINTLIPNPKVLDFIPDDINIENYNNKKEIDIEPYYKGREHNLIVDTLQSLPAMDQSDLEWSEKNKEINDALDERHKLMNEVTDDIHLNIKLGKLNKNEDEDELFNKTKWDLSRYYPNCKLNEGKTHFNNKTLEYCSNLPEINNENYKKVSGNIIELINKNNPYVNAFTKQHDIGGNGIIMEN